MEALQTTKRLENFLEIYLEYFANKVLYMLVGVSAHCSVQKFE